MPDVRPWIHCPLCGKSVRVGADHACPANAAEDARNRAAHEASVTEQEGDSTPPPDRPPARPATTGDIDA